MKPTKQQVKETIAMVAECPVSAIKYDYKKKEFSYFEIVYTPHYDDGHSIDAMDIEEIPRIMSWKDALQIFRYYKNLLNMKFKKVSTPVTSVEEYEFELPF